jgi:hypothetical protein
MAGHFALEISEAQGFPSFRDRSRVFLIASLTTRGAVDPMIIGGCSPRRARIHPVEAWMAEDPARHTFADTAPTEDGVTEYDRAHVVTYLRLLDAVADGAAWAEVARLVLGVDPVKEPARAKSRYDSHLARARWMTEHGYRDLLRDSGR